MGKRIVSFELNGKTVLGFDTGLDDLAFAQAKLASFITDPGRIVRPGGIVEPWIPGGVIERGGTMVVWGPAFSGETLDTLIAGERNQALEALRRWLAAWSLGGAEICPWPAAALAASPAPGSAGEDQGVYPPGTVFFPPLRLVKRCLEAEGPEARRTGADQWVHPDLQGPEAAAFTAGALLYRIFSGKAPFPREDTDLLLQDIREGVFLPLRLAVPGLEETAARLITEAMAPISKDPKGRRRPSPEDLGSLLGPPGSRQADSWLHPLGAEEQIALEGERERFSKRRDFRVNTRRFVVRNTAIITGSLIVLAVLGLIAQSIIQGKLNGPTTRGMSPAEVVNAYYGAFGDLDHPLMEACVTGKAGKEDVSMVTNFFVLSRVRMAYDAGDPGYIPAQKWLDAGSPETRGTVFGVSDLKVDAVGENAGEQWFRASYRLWLPESSVGDVEDPANMEAGKLLAIPYTDELRLVLEKEAWRIAEIRREGREL